MQCPVCNATIDDGVAYCTECGAAIEGDGQPASGSGRTNQQQDGRRHGAQSGQKGPSSGQQGATGGQGAPPRQAQYSSGPSIQEKAEAQFSKLSWKNGIIGGLLLYGLVFAVLALLGSTTDARDPYRAAMTLLVSLATFVSVSDMAFALAMVVPDLPGQIVNSGYDAALAPLVMVIPWLLYVTGKRFAQWNDLGEGDVVGHVLSGATVIFGTAPFVAVLAIAFGGDFGYVVGTAGILIPVLAGGLGGLAAWAFAGESRAASWGTGFLTALVGFVVIFALTFVWADPDAANAVENPMIAQLMATTFAFVGVVTLGFVTDGIGFLAYVVVLGALVVVGYLGASRRSRTDLVSATRAGASIVAGFSTFVFVTLIPAAVLATPAVTDRIYMRDALGYLPEATRSLGLSAANPLGLGTLDVFLHSFMIGAIVVPLVFGGLGGAIAGYRAMDRGSPMANTGGRPQGPGAQGAGTGGQYSPAAGSQGQPAGGQQPPVATGQATSGGQPSTGGQRSTDDRPDGAAVADSDGKTPSGDGQSDDAEPES